MAGLLRTDVWASGGDFNDPRLLWYARGVAAMQSRDFTQPTSWAFYAAMHDYDFSLWQSFGYYPPGTPLPPGTVQDRFWHQCQHGSWYFLPWHRGYLLAFEKIIRDEVKKAGGPGDWSLPYWNYFKAQRNELPPAFAAKTLPDGTNNRLYVEARYGPDDDGHVYIPVGPGGGASLDALQDAQFTGPGVGISPGFGGIVTRFINRGRTHGGVERDPHDAVHGLVGGQNKAGLMGDPRLAALDPIFWLHHANIDRLWEVWLRNAPANGNPTNVNPTDPSWLNGPQSLGDREFVMPMFDGTTWVYAPKDVVSLEQLGYAYDDVSSPLPPSQPAQRLFALGATNELVAALQGVAAVQPERHAELAGTNDGPLQVRGSQTSTVVQLAPEPQQKVIASIQSFRTAAAAPADLLAGAPPQPPDQVFLNIVNVRSKRDGPVFQVFVGVPESADPQDHPDLLAGTFTLFGVAAASDRDRDHAGQGVTFVLDITKAVDALHLSGDFNTRDLSVRIVPRQPVPDEANVTIERVTVYREGAAK